MGVVTDNHGYACLDLVRCAKYSVLMAGLEDKVFEIRVPDAPSVSLPNLLFETVSSVSYSPVAPYQVSVGSEIALTPTILSSTAIPIPANSDRVLWSVSDSSIVSLSILPNELKLRGLKKGETLLRCQPYNQSIVKIPYSVYLTGSTQTITVV
jgi:hypothetical protein